MVCKSSCHLLINRPLITPQLPPLASRHLTGRPGAIIRGRTGDRGITSAGVRECSHGSRGHTAVCPGAVLCCPMAILSDPAGWIMDSSQLSGPWWIDSVWSWSLLQTPHHRPAKMVFSTVPSNSDWQWTVELQAGWRGVPMSTVSQSCKEQLKVGLRWPVVWHFTFSGVWRMISCRRLNILCRVNTKGKWQIQRRMYLVRRFVGGAGVSYCPADIMRRWIGDRGIS